MKFISRVVLLPFILVSSLFLCVAQESKTANEPPPEAAVERNPENWKTFFSSTGLFSVSLPGTPTTSTQELDTAGGQITQHLFHLTTGAGFYLVSYFDVAAASDDPQAIKSALDAGRDKMLANNKKLKLLSEQEFQTKLFTGRDMLLDDGAGIYRMKAFMVGKRSYQMVFGTPHTMAFKTGRPSADPADRTEFFETTTTKFFGSFKLTPSVTTDDDAASNAAGESQKTMVRGGVINGKAIRKPAPAYPPIALSARAQGTVMVEITIDEEGKVISAKAISGHPLLRAAAVEAAYKALFSKTQLEGMPVKVTGVITYNFTLR